MTKKIATPKLFLATPAYDGKVNVQYALALADTISLLRQYGVEVITRISASGSLLVAERNRLLEEFRRSDCTHALLVDSDLGWAPEGVLAMLQADKELVAGVYPARRGEGEFLFRPALKDGNIIENDGHLLKMEYVPAGFMMIKHVVVEKLVGRFPELYFQPKDTQRQHESAYCLFDTEVWEGEFWGEDYVFCRRCREAGIDIWVDPLITFDHNGTVGMLLEFINKKQQK